jgi:hypothetical protein
MFRECDCLTKKSLHFSALLIIFALRIVTSPLISCVTQSYVLTAITCSLPQAYMNYVTRMNVLPMTYTIVEAYVKTAFNMMKDRDLDIVCTLRGSNADPTRLR